MLFCSTNRRVDQKLAFDGIWNFQDERLIFLVEFCSRHRKSFSDGGVGNPTDRVNVGELKARIPAWP